MKKTVPKKVYYAVGAAAAFFGIIVYSLLDPASNFFPRCPVNMLTGLKCPGCGSQRALHQLLHLNIAEAIEYNALMVFSIPILLFLLFANFFGEKYPKVFSASRSPLFSRIVLAVILAWTILRNIFSL